MLGLLTGMPGARAFRQTLSDSKRLALGDPALLLEALQRSRATPGAASRVIGQRRRPAIL
jgi:tRNA-dihydrouridine synthase A